MVFFPSEFFRVYSRDSRATRSVADPAAHHKCASMLLPDQAPAGRQSRAKCGADNDVVVQIHYYGLTGTGLVKHIVWLQVSVKVGYYRQRPSTGQSRPISGPDERWSRQIPDCR